MSYIDGFVIAVPTKNKQKFIDHANGADSIFLEMGATRVLECWGDDVPEGKTTDFRSAVKDRKSTRLNSSHVRISYAVFCLKKKKTKTLGLKRQLYLRRNPRGE